MITKKLKRVGNDLFFVCHGCKQKTRIRNIVPRLEAEEDIKEHPNLFKTGKTAPIGTAKSFFSAVILSLIVSLFVGDILDMPPILVIISFGFVFEFILNPILLYFWGEETPIWVSYCESCKMKWQLVISKKSMLLVFRFLF